MKHSCSFPQHMDNRLDLRLGFTGLDIDGVIYSSTLEAPRSSVLELTVAKVVAHQHDL